MDRYYELHELAVDLISLEARITRVLADARRKIREDDAGDWNARKRGRKARQDINSLRGKLRRCQEALTKGG